MKSPLDKALEDFYFNDVEVPNLIIHNNYGDSEEMSVEVFFRDPEDFTELDQYALSLCKGRILDIGAGAGAHSLFLQLLGHDVTALEISATACEIMKIRGIDKIINDDLYSFKNDKFDTILILMNGFGLSKSINNIPNFLNSLKHLLKPDGVILTDSSNVSYVFDELPVDRYYGEMKFCFEYKGIVGEWFDWLYIDQSLFSDKVFENRMVPKIIFEDENDQYLAQITFK